MDNQRGSQFKRKIKAFNIGKVILRFNDLRILH